MTRLARPLLASGFCGTVSGKLALFLAVAAVTGITAGHARAAEAEASTEFGLVDVITGLPASGEAIPVDADELVYSSRSPGAIAGNHIGNGIASYYGARFAGKPTASGALFDPSQLTAAHRSLPFGSRVLVTSEQTGQSVVVTITDRGPYHGNRVIDLSEAAAGRIGLIRQGSGPVSMALLAQ